MQHIRIPEDIDLIIKSLNMEGSAFPRFAGRSAVHVACELIRESPTFQQVKSQMASERHPRPGARSR